MGFVSFWPLALLVLVPIIIILYILKQEAKPLEFSSTMLWREAFRNIEAKKPWEKLRKNILLILQILTVLLFVLALMGPWLKAGKAHKQVVIVIDSSASMEALYTDKDTRLEAAKSAACDYVESLPVNTSINVISGNKQAVLILSNSTDRMEIKNRINGIEQSNYPGDLSVTLGLVQSCISQAEDCDVVFYTDSQFDIGDLNASVASFYSDYDNYSLSMLSYAQDGDDFTVLASVTNYSSKAGKREVNLYGKNKDGKTEMIDIQSVELEAQEVAGVYFNMSSKDAKEYVAFKAEINEEDGLASDNSRWCSHEDIKENKVLLLSKSNVFIEKALGNLPGIELERSDDLGVLKNSPDYDLYIFDGIIPDEFPKTGSCLLINTEMDSVVESSASEKGCILEIEESDVTSFIEDGKIGVNKTKIFDVPTWGDSFLKGNKGSAGFCGNYEGRKIAAIGFDLHQSDFCLQVEFPILMSNLSDYLLGGGIVDSDYFTVGDSIMLHGNSKGEDINIITPSGKTKGIEAINGVGSYFEVDEMGIYSVSQKNNDQLVEQNFASVFPCETESWVEPADNMFANGSVSEVDVRTGMLEIRNYILIVLLLLLMAEWVVYIKMQ